MDVSDRITLGVTGTAGVDAALGEFKDYLMAETLATEWQTGQNRPLHKDSGSLDDEQWTIEISR